MYNHFIRARSVFRLLRVVTIREECKVYYENADERKCITMKFNIVQVANIAGMALSIAGTVLSAWAGKKGTEEEIAKQVAKAFGKNGKH